MTPPRKVHTSRMSKGLGGLAVLALVGAVFYLLWSVVVSLWSSFGWQLLFVPAAVVLIYFVGFIIDKGTEIADRKWPEKEPEAQQAPHPYSGGGSWR